MQIKEKLRNLISFIFISSGMALATSCLAAYGVMFGLGTKLEVIWGIACAGILVMMLSLCFSELSSVFPSGPGLALYIKKAYGEKVSLFFLILCMVLLAALAGVECFIFSSLMNTSFHYFFPHKVATESTQWIFFFISQLLLIIIMISNLMGLEVSRKVQNRTTFILLIGIISMSVAGIFWQDSTSSLLIQNDLTPSQEEFSFLNLIQIIGVAVFLYVGFEWVIPTGKSRLDYQRAIPLSMPLSILILSIMYVLFALALNTRFPQELLINNMSPQVLLARIFHPQIGILIVLILSALAVTTSFNAGLMGGARLLYSLSREKILPPSLSKISDKGTPYMAIIILSIFALGSSLLINLFHLQKTFTLLSALIECLIYTAVLSSYLKLKKMKSLSNVHLKLQLSPLIFKILLFVFPLLGLGILLQDWRNILTFSMEHLSHHFWIFLFVIVIDYFLVQRLLKKKEEEKLKLRRPVWILKTLLLKIFLTPKKNRHF